MICIVKLTEGKITGWMICSDVHDARRRAQSLGERDLAEFLYRMEFPPLGQTPLGNGYIMLVDLP